MVISIDRRVDTYVGGLARRHPANKLQAMTKRSSWYPSHVKAPKLDCDTQSFRGMNALIARIARVIEGL